MVLNNHISISFRCIVLMVVFLITMLPASAEEAETASRVYVSPIAWSHYDNAKSIDSHGLGYIAPPVDLSHLTGESGLEQLLLAKAASGKTPKPLPGSFDWRDQSGKNYVTSIKDQGLCGACYSFASLANFESRILIEEGTPAAIPETPIKPDLSEENVMECNWQEVNDFTQGGVPMGGCSGGNYWMVANLLSTKGTVLESCDPYSANDSGPCNTSCPYQDTLLEWCAISGGTMPNTDTLKTYIQEYGPVYTTMFTAGGYGFNDGYDGSYTFDWHPGDGNPGAGIDHAVMIVGWSDNLPPVQGSGDPAEGWIVKNSWGPGWGDEGYFYITYGSANIGWYSSFTKNWQEYDTDGGLLYYDEAGTMGAGIGYGDADDWGLCKFIPSNDINITRIEFWTANAATIDAYIYDEFDGSTPASLIWSSTGNVFGNAGYHSIELDTPVSQNSGDDIVAVVRFKFADTSNIFTVPVDLFATPFENGKTFFSDDGANWTDAGFAGVGDIGIRLRYNRDADSFTLNMSKSGNGSVTPSVGSHEYAAGLLVDISAVPDIGWEFVNWTGQTGSIGNPNAATTAITMDNDYSIQANFAPQANVIYVKESSIGNGSSWLNAFGNLQQALDVATPGDHIWVTAGVYTPVRPGSPGARTDSFQMKNGVEVYGGFPPNGNPGWGNRNWETYETILSGELGNPMIETDNCYHVFYHPDTLSLNSSAVLDGFTIADGYADGSGDHHNGGGMFNNQSSPTLHNCRFDANDAVGTLASGGGMYNFNYSDPLIMDCSFSNNSAESGGGMTNHSNSSPLITDCVFSSNSTTVGGGGIYNSASSSPHINRCSFDSNSSVVGGGLNNSSSAPVVTNCTFSNNGADSWGGGIYNSLSSITVTNCIFTGNSAETGGAMDNSDSSPNIVNCVIIDNAADQGGGISNSSGSNPQITNCVLWDNDATIEGDEIYNNSATPVVTYCDVQGGYSGNGNIDQNPKFVSPATGDFHLQFSSPCINAGSNAAILATGVTEDYEGDPRIIGPAVDIGVDEAPSGAIRICNPMIAAGARHTVGLKDDGTVIAVGNNDNGQCNVSGWTNIKQIAAGDYHTLGLKIDGTVVAAGLNDDGQCDINSWSDIEQIAAGDFHSLGLKSDGNVLIVGDTIGGQSGIAWSAIEQVEGGRWHSVGLAGDGSVRSTEPDVDWGQGDVDTWANMKQVAAGDFHTIGVKNDGSVLAIGNNASGQLNVTGWKGIRQVDGGKFFTLGLTANDTVVSAGDNEEGQCNVGGWSDIRQIAAGENHSVGLRSDGTVIATGLCGDGQCDVYGWDLGEFITEDYVLTIGSTTGGHVISPGEGSFSYGPGTVVNLEAVAENGYVFVGWMGDVGTIANVDDPTTTIMMSGNYSVQAVFLGQTPEDSVYYAVICGISDYYGSFNDLDYCDDDARDLYNALLGFHNWSAENMQLLIDSDATEANIQSAIQTMGMKADENDVCLFFFSGHGGYGMDLAPKDEVDNLDEFLCPYYLDTNEILDDELSTWLGSMNSDNVIVWIDTCFSGGMMKHSSGAAIKSISENLGELKEGDGFAADFNRMARDINTLKSPYISTAADDNEMSFELPSLEHGVYTYFLLESLENSDDDSDGWISGEETFEYLYPEVVDYFGGLQHPQEYDASPVTDFWPEGEALICNYTGAAPTTISVVTGEATDITTSSAKLVGMLIDPGENVSVDVSFEYGTQSGLYLNSTEPIPMNLPGVFDYNIIDLLPNTRYYYRVKASAGSYTAWGHEQVFITDATRILYVDGNASGADNGESWADAYNNLGYAITQVAPGEQIWVASGTYTPTLPGETESRSDSFYMKNNVGIYGGFTAVETDLNQRDWQKNPTVLSGDIGVTGYSGDNCYHVIYNPKSLNIDSNAVIDGFTIIGGNADGATDMRNNGAGIFNVDANPTISNCIIRDNTSIFMGGGMLNHGYSSPIVINCLFYDNESFLGGGMYNNRKASTVVTNCTFYDNTANRGGGIYNNQGSNSTITNCILWDNHADKNNSVFSDDTSPSVSYSNVQVNPGSPVYPGPGNSGSPPLFQYPEGGDFHLRWDSPCIDKGINTAQNIPFTDFEGQNRIINGTADMGADEYTPPHLDLSPGYGLTGSEITITGYHFGGTPVRVSISGSLVAVIDNLEDLDGDQRPVMFDSIPVIRGIDDFMVNTNIPRIVETSAVEITASCYDPYNEATFTATAQFDVFNRRVTFNPNSGPPGTIFSISGAGFPANEPDATWDHSLSGVALYQHVNSLATGTVTTNIITGQNGSFAAMGQIPYDALPGMQDIIIYFDPTDPGYDGKSDPDELASKRKFTITQTGTKVLYVDASNTGIENGQSWATAYSSLQSGLDASYFGDEIWVASGIYYPSLVHGGSEPRYQSFQLKEDVRIYGGFIGTETDRNQRDWYHNTTVLSGDIGIPGDISDNCYHVFFHPDDLALTSSAVLDGFTITKGKANGPGYHFHGGGMFNRNCSPTISNCVFTGNAANYGGGMKNHDNSTPEISNTTFYDNSGGFGAGIHNDNSSAPELINCVFNSNIASLKGGGICSFGASVPVLANTILRGDTAGLDGNELFTDSTLAEAYNCDIEGDTSAYSGIGNIDQDPQWVDSSTGDFHLLPTSPCIDSGNNNRLSGLDVDFEGDDRIIDGDTNGSAIVDIGVDEYMEKVTCNLNISKTGNGSVIPPVGNHTFDEGAVINISAIPDSNWFFDEWTGEIGTIADSGASDTTITMSANSAITAVFKENKWLYDIDPQNDKIEFGEFLTGLGDYLDSQISFSLFLDLLGLYLDSHDMP